MAFVKFQLSGYGGEVTLHKVTKKCAEFWQSEEMSEYFHEYLGSPEWFSDEHPAMKVPKYAELPHWYECDNRGHEYGVAESMAQLEIIEVDGLSWNAKELNTIYYGPLSEFTDEHDKEGNMVTEEEIMPKPKEYTIACIHSEKGTFYDGIIEIEGEFDPSKVTFDTSAIHEDVLVTGIYYDGDYIDNEGGGTDGKSLDFDIIEPWEE